MQDLVEKSRVKRRLGRYRCRWKNNINMDLKNQVGGLDWSGLGQGQVADSCESGDEICGLIKYLTSCGNTCF